MSTYLIFALGSSVVAIFYGLMLARAIIKKPAGSARMQDIAKAIEEGATAYLNRQYKVIAPIALVLALVLWFAMDGEAAIGFLLGAFASALAGYIGMKVSGPAH